MSPQTNNNHEIYIPFLLSKFRALEVREEESVR